MKQRFRAALLALLIAVSVPLSANASFLFPSTHVYDGQFVDVLPDDWFYGNVAALYELGLTNGKGDTSHFEPQSDMTVAEVLTMAARLRSLYDFSSSEAGADFFRTDGDLWYTPYVAYLKFTGVISEEFDKRLEQPASRAEVAHALARALPGKLFENINADAVTVGYAMGRFIRDVNDYTPYQQDILALYRWGILSGVDAIGTFCPDKTVRRSEVAAMVSRLVDTDLRITLDWMIEDEPEIYSLSELVSSDGSFFSAPDPEDRAAIDADIRYMLARGERTLVLDYGTPQPEEQVRAIMDAFLDGVRCYPEQTYNQIHVNYKLTDGGITIRFSSSLYSESALEYYREQTLAFALSMREELYATGALRNDMTEYQKAQTYFNWLCGYCEYAFDCGDTDLAHSAYGAFRNRSAVCDGYTAAYNLLLRLEGIKCSAIDLEEWDHMWTVAVLDGVSYHIDVTWGDQTNTPIEHYFAMSEEESMSRFQ